MRWRRTRRGISCHELRELVTAYLAGALSAAEAARFEAHLDSCPGCAAYVAQFAQTINALGSLPAELMEYGKVGVGLLAVSAHKDEAWELAKFLCAPEQVLEHKLRQTE